MMRLHGYWRSGASYRVRIALNLKGLGYESLPVDLRSNTQGSAAFRALNPQGLVPVLETDRGTLIQSPAILEWLEETRPAPPLLPAGPEPRAIVRGMAALIGCDIHPLNNLRVLQSLRRDLEATEADVSAWIARWMSSGFDALEILVGRHGAGFAFGDRPGLVDCYLIPQLYSAVRFGVDLAPYPKLVAVGAAAGALPAFADAHPDLQPDAGAA